ncbi:hypothetical protein B0G76_8341 [Paraburkholderia sp. BL23I1N1]|uniref:hypothetical protein n=1 Tax=Paraburkholderia sp. BL23I1N1 TaxID=1938802 RepID=UPI000E70F741|nr:hypothetical protein [Paraburkholderia sp. BL23I1N1]RKE24453.1 hypothetical protein B0G76_8341 [Paraburkholderia sp. BL23I1N1]
MPNVFTQKLLSKDPNIYCSQGEISGGCATHAAAAALSVLGIIGKPSRISNPRCETNARQFWLKLKDVYTDGIGLQELGQRLEELDFGLTFAHVAGPHYRVLDFTRTALQKGRPVILSFAPLSCPRQQHAVLATGTEGTMMARRFVPSAILITDSSQSHPGIAPHNARLEFSPYAKRERSGQYVTTWERYRITLAAAISLRLAGSTRRDWKPP